MTTDPPSGDTRTAHERMRAEDLHIAEDPEIAVRSAAPRVVRSIG